jgi:uncharacterized cupredoxin-like copper-binding protein
MKTPIRAAIIAACLIAMGLSPAVRADEGHGHHPSFGAPGKAADAKRTVTVIMRDNSYSHDAIAVKAGETVKFVIRNEGSLLHEFNIGTPSAHVGHQKEMMQMMEMGMLTPTGIDPERMKMDHSGMTSGAMKHDDPNSVLIEPGKARELVWKFAKPMNLEFACNVPGHYQSGMVGEFKFGK